MSPLVFAWDSSEYNEKPNSKLLTSNYVIVDVYYLKRVVPTKAVPTVLIRKTRTCSRRLITLRDRSCIITRKQISKQETISGAPGESHLSMFSFFFDPTNKTT